MKWTAALWKYMELTFVAFPEFLVLFFKYAIQSFK